MAVIHLDPRGRSLPERIVYGVLILAVLVLGFFFLIAALIAGAILAVAVLLRLWWIKRKLTQAAQDEFITTEYRVVEHERLDAPRDSTDKSRPGG